MNQEIMGTMNPESRVLFEHLQKALRGEYSIADIYKEYQKLQEKQNTTEWYKFVIPKEMNLRENIILSIMKLHDDSTYVYEDPKLSVPSKLSKQIGSFYPEENSELLKTWSRLSEIYNGNL